jgi:putative endonuclease
MNRQRTGKYGEDLVCRHLKKNRYKILERNFRTRFGEIDIIAAKKGHTAFVEVKTRNTDSFGTPAESVGTRKQKSIILAAQQYIAQSKNADSDFSFDVAEVILIEGKAMVHYIENAFETRGSS